MFVEYTEGHVERTINVCAYGPTSVYRYIAMQEIETAQKLPLRSPNFALA